MICFLCLQNGSPLPLLDLFSTQVPLAFLSNRLHIFLEFYPNPARLLGHKAEIQETNLHFQST